LPVGSILGGRPRLKLQGASHAIADRLGVKNNAITITHDGITALAQVIFES
jgi:phosphopantetheinyl transferase (holo-ACP synthase)